MILKETVGQIYTYRAEDYSPESYLGIGTREAEVESSVYTIYYYPTNPLYNLLFEGTTQGTINFSKAYWLASTCVSVYDGMFASFTMNAVWLNTVGECPKYLFSSSGSEDGIDETSLAIRPIISLKSNITVEEIKITTGSEVDWSTSPNV